jgi:putative ABC transport system permease protein
MNLYKMAFNNIRRRKLRSALTMLGIIIGVATIVVLVGITAGATSVVKEETSSLMYDVTISPSLSSGSSLMDNQTASKVESYPKLYNVTEFTGFQETINGNDVTIQGTNNWKQLKLKTGSSGVVVDSGVAEKLGYTVGSKVKIKDQDMTVTGIAKENGENIYVDQSLAKQMADNKVSAITARTYGDPKTVAEDLQNNITGVSAQTKSEKVAEVQDMVNQSMLFASIIASVGLLVGIISVINTMLISVMERTKQLGILKAIGFTNGEIMGSTLFEAGILGFLGAVIGVVIGAVGIFAAANALHFTDYMSEMLPVWLIVTVIVGSTVLSILAGLYPARRASKLNVVEALRDE